MLKQLTEPNYVQQLSDDLQLKSYQIETVLSLVEEWATVPFIARYRKERTWNLNENQIREILSLRVKIENLYESKKTAINWITEQEKMTPELMENILKAQTQKEVEDIYKPYKSKRKTKAMIAIENGFQVIADELKKNLDLSSDCALFEDFLKNFTFEEIIDWACEIISSEISANSDLRADLKNTLQKYGNISSAYKTEKSLEKLNEKDTKQIPKFKIYNDFTKEISKIKAYQTLALNRGENLGILNVKIEKTEQTYEWISYNYARFLQISTPFSSQLEIWFRKWYDALFASVENEIRSDLSELAQDDAIFTFQTNLNNLLMTKPEYGNKILAIDPWYAAGCKIAVLNELGQPLKFDKIFLHRLEQAENILQELIKNFDIDVIVVWNWTWCDEMIAVLEKFKFPNIFIVNESWASVYSASKVAEEEFPDLDSLDRWTISIARRYIDPLSELVKVPVESIWVGMYQHDVPVKKLEEKLGYVVEDVVNNVWISVNTASSYVLTHISWIDKRLAKKIFKNRPYSCREELAWYMSQTQYEQAIWFLRIPESSEKLDNTDIHPQQYALAKYILENNITPGMFEKQKIKLRELYQDSEKDTIEFILKSIEQAGKEKRNLSTHKKVSNFNKNASLQEWDVIDGIVKNVVAFGAFVDIGTKNDWLVHISEIANEFVKDPKDFLEVGQSVKVKILNIDEQTQKLQLSIKQA